MRNTLKTIIQIMSSFCLLMIANQTLAQSVVVDFVPSPLNTVVNNGDNFSVVIGVQTNGQATAGAEIHMDFDPAFLEVVSFTNGTALPVPLVSSFDNGIGQLDYAAGTFGAAPTADFTLVTINFLAKGIVSSTTVTYETVFPRQTTASFGGVSILDEATPFTVTINSPCNITNTGLVVNACNDGGTPSDPSDDTFSFTIDPTGTDLGTTYTVSGDVSGTGTYGTPNTFSGQQAGGGNLSVTITDNDNAGCATTFSVTDPGSCSNSCNIVDAGLTNLSCNDNGTPNDPTDDFITFSLNPTGSNLGSTYSVAGDISLANLSYGLSNFFTLPGTAGQGDLSLTLTDDLDANCQLVVSVTDPGTCSNQCNLTASGLSNISCDDNGTPADPSDDFITFDLDPLGFNLGASYTVTGATGTGTYGATSSFVSATGTAGIGDLSITIVDATNGGCSLAETVTDPGSCSNQCDIAASGLANITCNDNGTPTDPSDDYFTFEINPSGNALTGTYSVTGAASPATATYGSATVFSSAVGTAGGGDLSITIVDGTSGACSLGETVTDPGTCSNQCLISDLALSNIQCNDNGTPGDPSDDYITFDLNPTGNGLGSTYNLPAGFSPATASYGSTTNFSSATGTAGAGDISLTVTDDTDNGCTGSATITDPGTCSNANTLSFNIGSGGGITCGSLLIPVTVSNYIDILGGQGSINWDPAVITFVAVSDFGIVDLSGGSFNDTPGQLNFSYNDPSISQLGHSLADGDTLFLMEFDVSGALGGSTSIGFSTVVPALFFDNLLNTLNPLASVGNISIPNVTNITGKAVSELGSTINGVSFKMSGTDNPPIQTGNPGFDFTFTRCGVNEIGAFKNNDVDVDNGVNTLDIIFMQRQILGIAPLGSPYKNLAADVNNNGLVEGLDITFIRQMILQQRQAFPEPGGSNALGDGTRLWKFTPSDAVFPVPFSPIAFDSGRVYNPINPLIDQDFIGMKLGDVDNSWDPLVGKTGAVGDIVFEMPDAQHQAGDIISIPVSVKDFQNVTGYQFTISWNPSMLAFLEVENQNLQTIFGEQKITEGHLTASWNDPMAQPVNLTDGTEIFMVRFQVLGTQNVQTSLSINSTLTTSEAYNGNLQLLNIVSDPATITLGSTTSIDPADNNGFGLYQNVPNPFGAQTDIIFELPEPSRVQIEIYNSLGQIVRSFEGQYPQGKSQIQWDGANAEGMKVSAGIYFARMKTKSFNGTIQMQKSMQ